MAIRRRLWVPLRTNPESLRQQIAKTDFYVVKADDTIVGCVYLEQKNDSLHFCLLTVVAEYRKTGIAPAIMEAIEAFARKGSYRSIVLNYMSLALWLRSYYERFGFVDTGRVINRGSIGLVHMSKNLEQAS